MAYEVRCYRLQSADGLQFAVREQEAKASDTLRSLLEDELTGWAGAAPIPVPDVGSATLARIVLFMRQHVASASEAAAWWEQAAAELDVPAQLAVLRAANYLAVMPLVELCQRRLVMYFAGLPVEQLYRTLGITRQEGAPK